MSFDADRLYKLLPEVLQGRDYELGREWAQQAGEWKPGADYEANRAAILRYGPLRQLVEVLADHTAVLEESLHQLRDNSFVETAAPWALPYLADLLGLRGVSQSKSLVKAPRAEIAHTIGYRRRKGTAAMLELLARDVTGWPARAVEYFERLCATQHLNHIRRNKGRRAGVRNATALEATGTPFEPHARTVEVRRIEPRRGKWNIPGVGVHVWRIRAHSLTLSPMVEALIGNPPKPSNLHLHFHPLRLDQPLYNRPVTEEESTQLAGRLNVPAPITARALAGMSVKPDDPLLRPTQFHPATDYYGNDGASRSIVLYEQMPDKSLRELAATEIIVADLADIKDGGGNVVDWGRKGAATAHKKILLDPWRGRVLRPSSGNSLYATFHYGAPGPVGGGEYDRSRSLAKRQHTPVTVANQPGKTAQFTTIADAIKEAVAKAAAPDYEATVEILDSGRYIENLPLLELGKVRLEIRAADQCRPALLLNKTCDLKGEQGASLALNGLLISLNPDPPIPTGPALKFHKVMAPGRLELRHCTLLGTAGPALEVQSEPVSIKLEDCFTGAIKVSALSSLEAVRCLIDGGAENAVVVDGFGVGKNSYGPETTLRECTVVGQLRLSALTLASNCIFASDAGAKPPQDWPEAVMVQRRQEGCVRFCFLPRNSRVPQRHQCLPAADAPHIWPVFTSLFFGDAAYGQLAATGPGEIRRGADDESEPGVWHDLFQSHRESYLAHRLAEYLRLGMEAGVFAES